MNSDFHALSFYQYGPGVKFGVTGDQEGRAAGGSRRVGDLIALPVND